MFSWYGRGTGADRLGVRLRARRVSHRCPGLADPAAQRDPGTDADACTGPDRHRSPEADPVTIRTGQDMEPASDFRIDLLSGEELALSDLRGKVVVLNFWATWCPPCREEMPSFESIYREYKDRDVVFVGVAVADTEERARDFVEGVGVTYPIGLDTSGIAEAYKVTAMPTTFFIDREGTITRKLQGLASEGALRLFLDIRVP